MSLTYEQFADIIASDPSMFQIEKITNGRRHVYRGRDLIAFYNGNDHKQHEHKAFTLDGNLVYHRDVNGVVRIGSEGQKLAMAVKRRKGSALLWGVRGRPDTPVADAVRRGVRWGLGGFGPRR